MILVLPDLEILQDQNLLRSLSQKRVKEILTIKEAIPGLNLNLSKKAQTLLPAKMKRLQKLKVGHISPIQVKGVREKPLGNLLQKEAGKVLIPETSMKEAA